MVYPKDDEGSILGPFLFLIYITDLILSSKKNEYIMYADDTTLIYTQPKLNNVEDNVNNELRCISNWFKTNKLLLNLKKTNFCVFHNNCRDMSTLENIPLAIDSIPISKVNVVNFLGIQIDSDLKWDVHINNIKSKISKCIGILYKLRFHIPSSVLFTLYNSLVLPYLSYCIVVWG